MQTRQPLMVTVIEELEPATVFLRTKMSLSPTCPDLLNTEGRSIRPIHFWVCFTFPRVLITLPYCYISEKTYKVQLNVRIFLETGTFLVTEIYLIIRDFHTTYSQQCDYWWPWDARISASSGYVIWLIISRDVPVLAPAWLFQCTSL